jgi:hypothetical protein
MKLKCEYECHQQLQGPAPKFALARQTTLVDLLLRSAIGISDAEDQNNAFLRIPYKTSDKSE